MAAGKSSVLNNGSGIKINLRQQKLKSESGSVFGDYFNKKMAMEKTVAKWVHPSRREWCLLTSREALDDMVPWTTTAPGI